MRLVADRDLSEFAGTPAVGQGGEPTLSLGTLPTTQPICEATPSLGGASLYIHRPSATRPPPRRGPSFWPLPRGRVMIASTSVMRVSRVRSLLPRLSSSCARISLSLLPAEIAAGRLYASTPLAATAQGCRDGVLRVLHVLDAVSEQVK
jgi:hypothetical protein